MKKSILSFIGGVVTTAIIFIILFSNYLIPINFYKFVKSNFDGEVNSEVMLENTLAGITAGFGDPHTSYIKKSDVDSFNQLLDTSYEGIGIKYTVNKEDGTAQVSEVMPNSPAASQNIYPGDFIKEVNGEAVTKENVANLSKLIKANKDVHLVTYRPSTDETITIDMQLGNYTTDSVYSKVFTEGDQVVGYIKIDSFSNTTGSEFAAHLAKLEEQNITKLVIDVRDNGGGELKAVEQICNLIVPNTKPYLIIKEGDKVVSQATSTLETPKPYEIVGIQNGNSASASEILMGALKEVNGSQIIGTTSYGKGSVQRIYPVRETGGAVKITIQHWFTPDGNTIDGTGIEPTIKVDFKEHVDYLSPIVLNEILKEGNTSVQSRQLNYYLYVLGYDVDSNSNSYSAKTTAAVRSFQVTNNLPVTGNVDVVTADMIFKQVKVDILNPQFDPQLKAAIGA